MKIFFASSLLILSQSALGQFSIQGHKLVGTGSGGSTPEQGYSVALSSDGSTAIVGGWDDNSATGAAWIFTRSGTTWSQQGTKLVGNDGSAPSYQGSSVAISADGNTAIVGGYFDNTRVGAAWVYTRTGSVWSQQGSKLVGTGVVNVTGHQSYQGYSVGLSADGSTAIVGGEWDNGTVGASWIYHRSDTVWTQVGSKLVGSDRSGLSEQGCSVAMSGDGMTAVVGGLNDAPDYGSAWIYALKGGSWVQQGNKLALGFNSAFGNSVAISNDGNTVLVGAPSDFDFGYNGAVYVYVRSITDSTWKLQGNKLVPSDASGLAQFGVSVALSSDGNTALIGAHADNQYAGAAWVFKRSTIDSAWTQYGSKLVAPDTSGNARQGYAVAISGDGATALVGGYTDSNYIGATWVYVGSGAPLPVELVSFTGSASGSTASLSWQTATEVDRAEFDVQRMKQGQSAWSTIQVIRGAGSSNAPREYAYSDKVTEPGLYHYRLRLVGADGRSTFSSEVQLQVGELPAALELSQNYPNPFNPSTTISFKVPFRSFVSLKVFDTMGREVSALVAEDLPQGTYTRQWFANGVASGVYYCILRASDIVQTQKMLLLK